MGVVWNWSTRCQIRNNSTDVVGARANARHYVEFRIRPQTCLIALKPERPLNSVRREKAALFQWVQFPPGKMLQPETPGAAI